ncbi:uncharacterized protein LOC131008379 [Salvia miltiorrhiza]|uniref:uncharacterized protein LOC131008379 n=1 Tax=Salvia miltiorrhiza TaxID=226208 RepID=UPI0025AD45F1|nr:uncharacterized protein LOC131008379 [Salvia miltiorrhiza]
MVSEMQRLLSNPQTVYDIETAPDVGLGPIENDESWTWFFHRLRVCFDQPDDLLIVSDQHKRIKNAVELMYPNAAHGFCYYHIQKNLARYGQHVAALFKATAYTYRSEEFERNFAALHIMKSAAHKQLLTVGEHRWARLKCCVPRTSFMTSNAAESLNSRLLWARRLPVCSLLESFRTIVEKWFDKRRSTAAARSHELTEVVSSKVHVAVEQGHRLVVRGTTTHMFIVEEENTFFVVDLENRTCECREFELDQIPCRHACAAIRRSGLNVTDFVGRYFKQYALLETYAARIAPVPHPTSWNVPEGVSSYIVKPPIIKRQSGHPKMTRAQSTVETAVESSSRAKSKICSRCKVVGHNRRKCTASLVLGDVDLNEPAGDGEQEEQEQTVETRRRRKKKCSVCKSEKHTRNLCPMQVGES